MLILLLAYSLFQSHYGDASPIPASIELRAISACDDQDSRRSLWSIVWCCLTTIFLCTWVAVHPNIVFRPEKPNARRREKWILDPLRHFWSYQLPLFMWALFVPEYILAWSVRQFIWAGKIRKRVPGWTRTHGFFMLMGGFQLYRLPADAPSVPLADKSLTPSDFVTPSGYYSRENEEPVCPLQISDIPADILEVISPTKTELQDRGKSDRLTKLLVLVQTLWFVVQCIARGIRHLPLTELEVVTLAYAILNFFIYIFWWDKPRNVECPIRVYKTSTAEHKTEGGAWEWEDGWVASSIEKILIYNLGRQDNYVDYSQKPSLPMFWSGGKNDAGNVAASFGALVLGAGFGAIHFIAWYSEFPSDTELILWRLTCIALIAVPLTPYIIFLATGLASPIHEEWANFIVDVVFPAVSALLPPLYIAGRIATLLIAFTALRSLPDAAFVTVDWTTFIPHI